MKELFLESSLNKQSTYSAGGIIVLGKIWTKLNYPFIPWV